MCDCQIKQWDEGVLLTEINNPALLTAAVIERIEACRLALQLRT